MARPLPDIQTLDENGKLHSENDIPASVSYKGNFRTLKFYKHGKLHREGGKPAFLKYRKGELQEARYYKDGMLHNDNDDAALITTLDRLTTWKYYKNGVLHRDGDKPAEITEYKNCGETSLSASYYLNGIIHRDGDKPAFENEHVLQYCKNGHLHRDRGSAIIFKKPSYIHQHDRLRELKERECYFNGVCTDELRLKMSKFIDFVMRRRRLLKFIHDCAIKWALKIAIEWRPPHGIQYVKMMEEYDDNL